MIEILGKNDPVLYINKNEMLITRTAFRVNKEYIAFEIDTVFKTSDYKEAEIFAQGIMAKYCHDTGIDPKDVEFIFELHEPLPNGDFAAREDMTCPLCGITGELELNFDEILPEEKYIRVNAQCTFCGAAFDVYYTADGYENIQYNPMGDSRRA